MQTRAVERSPSQQSIADAVSYILHNYIVKVPQQTTKLLSILLKITMDKIIVLFNIITVGRFRLQHKL